MDNIKTFIVKLLQKCFNIASKEVAAEVIRQIRNETLAAQYLMPLSKNYFPWTRSALSPSSISAILNDIVLNRRANVVELGAGISTIYISRVLKEVGGHLYTIEHDKVWIDLLEKFLDREELDRVVTLIHAPLKESEFSVDSGAWYDVDEIEGVIEGLNIDLLIVDGPPVTKDDEYIRYPAVPFFSKYLSENYAIILDDVSRKGEYDILMKWQRYLSIPYKIEGSMAFLATGPAFKVF